ncbi:MAG: SH3 domain-containing protein [Acidimicrobiales bacterium]
MRRSAQITLVGITLIIGACSSDPPVESTETTTTTTTAAPTTSVTTALVTTTDTEPPATGSLEPVETTTSVAAPTCEAPVDQLHFVDVDIDDPDGGLNMRSAAGVENDIVGVFPRSSELTALGPCELISTFSWWEVRNPDDGLTGWVSSRFLSDLPVFDPGPGAPFNDDDIVGLEAPTLDALALAIATSYGFDEDATISPLGDPVGIDAQGGEVSYRAVGLKDDAIEGYQFDIGFLLIRDNEDELIAHRVASLLVTPLCRRSVTDAGLCA